MLLQVNSHLKPELLSSCLFVFQKDD